jgi:hypothetical protein
VRSHCGELAFGQRLGIGQQRADDGALAVIDVPDSHDVRSLSA